MRSTSLRANLSFQRTVRRRRYSPTHGRSIQLAGAKSSCTDRLAASRITPVGRSVRYSGKEYCGDSGLLEGEAERRVEERRTAYAQAPDDNRGCSSLRAMRRRLFQIRLCYWCQQASVRYRLRRSSCIDGLAVGVVALGYATASVFKRESMRSGGHSKESSA